MDIQIGLTDLGCIGPSFSRVHGRNWRRYSWLDFALSSLPCGPQVEASQKGN